jgi:translation initiation factor 1
MKRVEERAIIFYAFVVAIGGGFLIEPGSVKNRFMAEISSIRLNERSTEASESPRKKTSFTINPDLSGSISSDGILAGKPQIQRPKSFKLGVPSKTKPSPQEANTNNKPLLTKEHRQRTGNGSIDSTKQTRMANPENEDIQVLEVKRGSKIVTLMRGMTSPMEDRKILLKAMKQKLGVGGALVDGVLEIQGEYAFRAVEILQANGYKKARKVGK